MGPGRSSSLRIGSDSSAVARSGQTRGASDRSAAVELQNAPGALSLPLDKGKGRVNLIKYPGGSEYLKSAVQHALTEGPCHAPNPDPTRLADPNRFPGRETQEWDFFFFFLNRTNWHLWVWPTSYNRIKILYTYN